MPRRNIDENTVVYVASAWWRDSDPFATAVSLDPRKTERAIRLSVKEEAKRVYDDEKAYPKSDRQYGSLNAVMDAIAWSGVHQERLSLLVLGTELDEAVNALSSKAGVYFPQTI